MPLAAFDLGLTTFDEYQEAEIDTVVMLIGEGEDHHHAGQDLKTLYQNHGWRVLHVPVSDFSVPADKQILFEALKEAQMQAECGCNLVVHCFAGRGRTGMFLAMLARQVMGFSGKEAINWLRQYFPAVETPEQAQMVEDFEPKLKVE